MRISLLFFLAFSTSAAAAQVPTVVGPQALYEGQSVTAVDLIANPHRDVEPLRALVVQKPGQPYSQEKVLASIDALQKTGQFEKVTVNVIPDIAGLRLNFILEPAYYLGVVDFQGLAKYFSFTRLLQVVDMPEEYPYVKGRMPVAEAQLLQFLERNGYFQAQVHSESQIDDAEQLVHVTFVVRIGKQARIGKVGFEGPADPEQARLLQRVRSLRARFSGGLLKPGKPYTPERIKAATTLIKKTLTTQHRLASTVQENPPQYHAETNRVDVSFKVEVGPLVTIRTTGARLSIIPFLSGRQMQKLIPIYSEGTIDHDLVEEGRRNLVDHFQKKGFFDATVNADFQQQANRIVLVYEIDRGKKHEVNRISFQGNHQISEADLLPVITIKKSHILTHGSISQKLLKQSADNLQAFYQDKGYQAVKITPTVIDHEPKIDVAFQIEEGPQSVVDNVQVTGNNSVPENQLTAPVGFQIRSGAPFSARRLSEDRNRIAATYLNRGYLNAEVKTSVSRHQDDPHRVDVTYAVTERQMVRVSEVMYLGQKVTRVALIKKTAQVSSEAPMRKVDLLAAESRLYDLNTFDWSSVGPRKPVTDQNEEAAVVIGGDCQRFHSALSPG